MSDDDGKRSWFFMKEYPNPKADNEESTIDLLLKQVSEQSSQIASLTNRIENLESHIYPQMANIDHKLEKLIQSHKSLIAYFGSINGRDVRDLNYKIRSYASKNRLPPISFVPERIKTDM